MVSKCEAAVQFRSVAMSDSLGPHGLQHARPPCPSPTPRVYSNSSPLSQWCHPTISTSVVPFSSCLQSFPATGSFQISQLFTSGGQSIGVSASTSIPPTSVPLFCEAAAVPTNMTSICLSTDDSQRFFYVISTVRHWTAHLVFKNPVSC